MPKNKVLLDIYEKSVNREFRQNLLNPLFDTSLTLIAV